MTNQRSARFVFSSEANTRFECRVDDAAFEACASPVDLADLVDGVHVFEVRAIDAAGNVDPTPARRTWTVDTAPPDTQIEEGPVEGSVTGERSARFVFSSEVGARFECRVDGAAFAACVSPVDLADLADGVHSFEVRAIDAAGKFDPVVARRTWTVRAVVVIDPDPDRDGVLDPGDNCPATANADQADEDADRIGDRCDSSDGSLAPVPMKTAAVRVVSGEVLIKLPRGQGLVGGAAGARARAAQTGAPREGFVPLEGAMSVPLRSTLDTTRGRVELVTARDTRRRGGRQRGQFFEGLFQIRQIRLQRARRRAERARRLVTELSLRGGASAAACSSAAASQRRGRRRTLRRLVGLREGELPHPRARERRDGPWHRLAHRGSLRRHADARAGRTG